MTGSHCPCDPRPEPTNHHQPPPHRWSGWGEAPLVVDEWVLWLGDQAKGKQRLNTLVTVLRRCPDTSTEMNARLVARGARRRSSVVHAYTAEEYRLITNAARADVRAAAKRIRAAQDLLDRWRAGEIGHRDEEWDDGELLDYIDRHGDFPRQGPFSQPVAAAGGRTEQLMRSLYLDRYDAAAFCVLLIASTGMNGSTLWDAPAVHLRAPTADKGGTRTALVDIVKRRQAPAGPHSTAVLVDLPGWVGAEPESPARSQELNTPYGLYMLLVELTASARGLTGSDRLFLWWARSGRDVGKGIREAVNAGAISAWGKAKKLTADGEPIVLDTKRLRLTSLQANGRPVLQSDTTFSDTYLLRERRNIGDYQQLVAQTLDEELAKARASMTMPVLPEDAEALAAADPAVAAKAASGALDTPLGACVSHTESPYAPEGQPCRASFLKCLDCPCARALPRHLPVQVLVHDAIEARRADLDPLEWARRYAVPHAQLTDLLNQHGETSIGRARQAATDAQRALVARLLNHGLDL